MKLLVIFLLSPFCFFGQISFDGKVINSKSREIIPFATVGLVKENIGTNANEDGSFLLVSNSNKANDTLIVSCVGYLSKKLPVDLGKASNLVIELNEQEGVLDDVVIKNKNSWTLKTLNDFSGCGNRFLTTNGYQAQLAQHFVVDDSNALLTNIKICRKSMAILNPDKTIFRVRIYDINIKTKSPSTDLCNQIIEVKTKSKFVNINLEKYKIRIPNKEFFVAIEWLKISYNENKRKTKVNGVEMEVITYSPGIGWTDNEAGTKDVWMLDYKNEWTPMIMNKAKSVAIEAAVKY